MDNKNKKNNKKDKKGKNYSQYKYYEPEYYTNPITGFLITSNQNQEKNAVKDAYNFLNRYVEKEYEREIERILQDNDIPKKKVKTEKPVEEEKKEEEEEEDEEEQKTEESVHQSTSALLEKELKQYNKETRLFYNIDTKCKGIIFIKVNPLFKDVIDVKHIANKIVKDVRENLIPVSRFCFKLTPIQFATKAAIDVFEEQIKKMLAAKFKPEKPVKWVLHYKCRNNNKFSQKDFLDIILQNIGTSHRVDLKNPDYTIFLEINNHLMCLSILKKFNALKNYSLQLPGSIPPPKPKKEQNTNSNENAAPKDSLIGELQFEEESDDQVQAQAEEPKVEKVENDKGHESEEEIALV